MRIDSAARFYDHLGQGVRSGIPLASAVELAATAAGGWHARRAAAWSGRVTAGAPLAEAMAGEWPLAAALIAAGERSGRLPEMCAHAAETARGLIALRDEALAKAAYPALVITLALAIPGVPAAVVGDGGAWGVLGPPAAFWAIAIGGVLALRGIPWLRDPLVRLGLRSPAAPLIWPYEVSTAARIIAAGYAAGMLAPNCLELAAGAAAHPEIAARTRAAALDLRHGRLPDLVAALRRIGWPAHWLNQAAAGEAAGRGEAVMLRIAGDAHAAFATRLAWTVKVACGALYAAAVVATAVTVIGMYAKIYGQTAALIAPPE